MLGRDVYIPRLRSIPVMASTPIAVIWSLLSILVAGTCGFSLMQPSWLLRKETLSSIGMLSYCYRDFTQRGNAHSCRLFGEVSLDLKSLPSREWQTAFVLFSLGCLILCLGATLAVLTLCLPTKVDKKAALITGYLQSISVLLMTAGLLVFPLGFGSPYIKRNCGEHSRSFYADECQIGWGYMLAIMGTALAMFCPFLSNFTTMKVNYTHTTFV